MGVGDYLAALLTFDGQLDRKRYGSLLTPIVFLFGGLNFIGFLVGNFATWNIGGWVILAAMTGATLITIPLSARRARDVGWIPIFAPLLSVAASVSIAAFISLLLPVSTGIWRGLEQTGFGLFWWGLIFAACIGVWVWWWNSLLDRPTKGDQAEETAPPGTSGGLWRAPLWVLVVWTALWGVTLVGNLVIAARYYMTGEGDDPPWSGMLITSIMIAVAWYWWRSSRSQGRKT